jgi:hypothetical protein
MTNEELIELVNEVDSINADLYNQCTTLDEKGKHQTDPWIWMEIQYGVGQEVVVEFLGEYLYNTQDDPRKFDEDKNNYEPIERFLRNKANELIDKLQKIKL